MAQNECGQTAAVVAAIFRSRLDTAIFVAVVLDTALNKHKMHARLLQICHHEDYMVGLGLGSVDPSVLDVTADVDAFVGQVARYVAGNRTVPVRSMQTGHSVLEAQFVHAVRSIDVAVAVLDGDSQLRQSVVLVQVHVSSGAVVVAADTVLAVLRLELLGGCQDSDSQW